MNWKRPLLSLAALCASLLATPAVHAATNAVPDAEVPRYLNPQQVTQWNDAQKKFTQASADLIRGQKLATETADEGTLVKPDLTADHAKGNALVKDANTAKNDANRTLNTLRRAAADNRNKSRSASQLTGDTTFEVTTGQWPEAVVTLSKNVFTALNDQKYKHVYLAGVYSLEKDGKYAPKSDVAAQVRQQLTAADKNKTLAPKGEGLFKLGQENGKLFLSYPERAADQAGSTKSAVVVGEILFDPRSGYAAVSLRAVDLTTMRVVASQVMMLSVESTLGKLLGLRLTDVASKRIVPAAAEKASKDDETPPPVSVNLLDPDDYLSKAKQLKTSLGLASASHSDALPNRFAILMLKSYFVSEQKDLKTSDIDFLTQALPDEKPDVTATVPADLSGVWLLPNVDNLTASMVLDPLKARDLATGAETTVGKLTITRNLPKLELPKTEELKAAGY